MSDTSEKPTPIWRAIATSLRSDLADGHYAPGDKLPTESELSARFGVNRHTIRHALSHLIEEGLLRSRRGSGVFVTARPTDYPIGKRVRFRENLKAAGREPGGRMLSLTRRAPSEGEAAALAGTKEVCVQQGISLADGQPIAMSLSLFPADRLPGIEEALKLEQGVTAALQVCGVTDYTRSSTRLTAVSATATQALHLEIKEGAPLLRSSSLNVDAGGVPVEYGRTWFVGERITLTLDEDD